MKNDKDKQPSDEIRVYRYDITPHPELGWEAETSNDGEWCKYDNHKSAYSHQQSRIEELEKLNIELDKMNCLVNRGRSNLHKKLDKTEALLDDAVKSIKCLIVDADESWCTCGSDEGDGCYYHEAQDTIRKIQEAR